jgi:hypothetical protein
MTKLNDFWSEIIHICSIYIYNNKKATFGFVFPSYIGGGGLIFVCLLLFLFFLFMCIFKQAFLLFYL